MEPFPTPQLLSAPPPFVRYSRVYVDFSGLIPKIQSVATQNSEISAINEEAVTIPMGGKAVVTTKASVVVQCFAHGIPMPHVKWYKDGYLVDSTTRYRSLINGLLDIRSVSAVDDGDFTCVAKNKFGVRKASMRLIVVGKILSLICLEKSLLHSTFDQVF